jgi:hypothetical protein
VNSLPDTDLAVRQTPFTAIESPNFISAISNGAAIVKIAELLPLLIAVTVPSSDMSPVNIMHRF